MGVSVQSSLRDHQLHSHEVGFSSHFPLPYFSSVRVYATSLISEPDFIIASAAGMHYCDLLSPFRALEWIYIISLQGTAS